MFYLSQMLGLPVIDASGEELGAISDLAISTGEIFPRITSVAFKGPGKTPFMISWRKYVADVDDDRVLLNVNASDVRFSYLQPDEILVARDLMNKQIVDTQGMKIVRVNDIKLSASRNQLRLLGAEVGTRGLLRGLSPTLERIVSGIAEFFKRPLHEELIAWNYMDLLDRDLSQVKLSVTHKRLHELHPADVADILEQLDPQQRTQVFEHLDNAAAAEALSELEDEYQADVIDDLDDRRASQVLAQMDPDDAADIVGDLPYEKAEQLLRLMGVEEEKAIRKLLGYKEHTAGGIMTNEFMAVDERTTVAEIIETLRKRDEDDEPVNYVYTLAGSTETLTAAATAAEDEATVNKPADSPLRLSGVITMRKLVLAKPTDTAGELAHRDLITCSPDEDQELVAEAISRYDLLALPVIDEDGVLLGIVTVDDAFDVLEEEHDEDLALAGASQAEGDTGAWFAFFKWFMRREMWFVAWVIVICIVAFMGKLPVLGGALLLMPLVLLIADDVATASTNDLIDADSEDFSLGKIFSRDLMVGVIVAMLAGLVAAAGLAVLGNAPVPEQIATRLGTMVSQAVLPTAITVLVMAVFGAVLTAHAKRRKDRGKIASESALAALAMIVGAVLQIALNLGFIAIMGIGA